MNAQMPGSSYIMLFVAIAVFIYRQTRPQKLTVLGLWLLPLFLIPVTVLSVVGTSFSILPGFTPPAPPMVALAVAIGLAVGLPLGLARGRASKVLPGDAPGTIIVEPSLLFAVIWLGAFSLRSVLRPFVPAASPAYFALGDASIVFAASAIVGMRFVLFAKFKALNAESPQVTSSVTPQLREGSGRFGGP